MIWFSVSKITNKVFCFTKLRLIFLNKKNPLEFFGPKWIFLDYLKFYIASALTHHLDGGDSVSLEGDKVGTLCEVTQ